MAYETFLSHVIHYLLINGKQIEKVRSQESENRMIWSQTSVGRHARRIHYHVS